MEVLINVSSSTDGISHLLIFYNGNRIKKKNNVIYGIGNS